MNCPPGMVFDPAIQMPVPEGSIDFNCCDVVWNDVAYGASGGLAGLVIGGSASLGVFAIPGWVAGAIGGAIAGSGGNAILQLKN